MDDIKKKINEIVKKISKDETIASSFKKDPVKTVENLLGVDLPDETINKIIDGVKDKLTAEAAKSIIGKVGDMLKK